ncbi:MAG: MFS transporter, partial [Comamonadaceae bacterium]
LLARDQPRLRSRALMGGLSFGSVSVLFSTMALMLAGPVHRLGDAQIGLVGLAGVAGASMANVAGRLADRGLLQVTSGVSAALLALSWAALWQGGGSLAWFLAGMLLIDLALQGIHISNQNVIYKLAPQARSRVNAVYMTSYFIGAATGSALGSWAWQHGGWSAACGWGLALAVVAAGAWLHDIRLERLARRPPAAPPAPRAGYTGGRPS